MKKINITLFIILALTVASMAVFADRGKITKKSKSKVGLNITKFNNLRSSIGYNLKTGLSYKGSFIADKTTFTSTSISSYQKGNTTYYIPYKHKIVVSEMKQGYAGVKLIIKSSR